MIQQETTSGTEHNQQEIKILDSEFQKKDRPRNFIGVELPIKDQTEANSSDDNTPIMNPVELSSPMKSKNLKIFN